VADATAFCAAHGVMLAAIEATVARSMERLSGIEDGINALISPDPRRRDFLTHERLLSTLYRAVEPDPAALEFASGVVCLTTLADAIRAQLERMIQLNRTRADFAEMFALPIDNYNAGSRGIEDLFAELVKLSNSLNEEQKRYVREHMSEGELVTFDILARPAAELSNAERAEVKKAARELLARLKALLVLNWRHKAAAHSKLKLAIEDTLDCGLPRACGPELYQQKCAAVFEHVDESYPERKAGAYA